MRVSKLILFLLSSSIAVAQSNKSPQIAGANAGNSVNGVTLQISEFYGSTDCVTKEADEIQVINAAVDGANNSCLQLRATGVVDISDYFEAGSGSEFDVQIVGEITGGGGETGGGTGGGETPPPSTGGWIDQTPDSEKQCENFSNHGAANPHLYAHASSNSLTGDLMAKYAPEYMVEGLTGWKDMYTAGKIAQGTDLNYYFFHEPSDGAPRNILLRTKAGCPEYRDVRNTLLYTNTLEEWYGLPGSMPALPNPTPIDVNFMVNSELEARGLYEEIAVYNLFADRVVNNLGMRVNGYNYIPFRFYDYHLFLIRGNHNLMDTPPIFVNKDFYMDISTDGFNSAARYTVHRNYQGGHWSVVTTATRHDGRVTVTAQGISWEMDQLLVDQNTGQAYNNISTFGNVFDLGFLPDGDYVFALKTYHGVTINNRILVRVKRPPIN